MILKRLMRNEHILKTFFETTPDILVIMDENGRILDCNHHFTKNFGYEKIEALGKIGPVDMVSPKDRQKALSAFGKVVTDGINLNVQLEVMRKDGSVFSSLWSGTKLSDELGNMEGYLVTGKDLSDIHRLEDELRKEKDQKLLIIGDMTARIAHDIRNPLNVIINSAKLLELQLDANPNTNMSKHVTAILKSSERMRHQIEDVMDYVSNRPLNMSECSVTDLILSSIETVLIPNNILVNFAKEDDVKIMCDKNQLSAVCGNLLLNSIQAIGENQGTITVDWKVDAGHIVIDFIDSGPGISEKILPQIFEPFFTTKQVGTGLGLVSCEKIVERHNGTIHTRNNPTTFTVVLPVI
ncbi:two-component system sensor histidine kinase NtrB [Candidatus Nitrosotalea bavarica]|uniref:two-component system sensor histidine kinase NtrB n=1 Tax=Candidatus Nitrosotalea bavarica TaxID=1903277 RepID=UPI000C70D871|nr:ATP-binding protein [Candidatus Nitrosotalea bavarica]